MLERPINKGGCFRSVLRYRELVVIQLQRAIGYREGFGNLLAEGSSYVVGRGLGTPDDLAHTEANGRIDGADPELLSDHALTRGEQQCGTLGSGNHFLEVQVVDHVFDEPTAQVFGLEKDQICVMIHSGSRGLGYQVCDDALAKFRGVPEKHGIDATREILAFDKDAKIVVCSAVGFDDEIQAALAAGARYLILKPFMPEEIVETINKLLTED